MIAATAIILFSWFLLGAFIHSLNQDKLCQLPPLWWPKHIPYVVTTRHPVFFYRRRELAWRDSNREMPDNIQIYLESKVHILNQFDDHLKISLQRHEIDEKDEKWWIYKI